MFESACTKCSWDLYKGDIVPTENEGRIACPLCGTTYGEHPRHPPTVLRVGYGRGGAVFPLKKKTASFWHSNSSNYKIRKNWSGGRVLYPPSNKIEY